MNTLACTVSQKSLTKNFIIRSMERQKIGQIQGRIRRRRLVRNPTIQYIIINLHTKYEYSSLHSFTEIFDEKFHHSKYGKKEIGQIQGRISSRRLVRNPTIQYIIINLHTKYDYSSLHSFTEIFDEKISSFKVWKERKLDKYREEYVGEGWFAIPRYNALLSTCSPNMTTGTLACTVSEKSLTKNFIIQSMERKKIGQIQGRISSRRLVRNPTIQYIIINLHTKYDYSSLHGFTEIFDEKISSFIVWKERKLDKYREE